MKYSVKIKGNSKPYYDVSLIDNGSKIIVMCTCPAGDLGQLCHHKTDLLNGDISTLYDTADAETLTKITSLIKNTNYQKIRQQYIQIKQDIEKLKTDEKNFRKKLERMMNNGLKFNIK